MATCTCPLSRRAGYEAAPPLDQLHLDAGVTRAIAAQKRGEQARYDMRRRRHLERAGIAALERARSVRNRIGAGERLARMPQQVLALRRQAQAASAALEQGNAELRFERLQLTRGSRLTQVQAFGCASNAARIGRRDEQAH